MTIKEINKNNQQLLELSNNNSKAIINLDSGASLQEFLFQGKTIINDQSSNYKTNYASSILFPFVNRIDDGEYKFQNKEYQFSINELDLNNAIHGLVYDKKFGLIDQQMSENKASILLEYDELSKNIGFPFTYKIQLKYELNTTGLQLNITVKNTDISTFPFTIGWHPYFYSRNLKKSKLSFNADKKVIHTKKMIAKRIENYTSDENLRLENLDDCFHLTDKTINFKTPDYNLNLSTSFDNSYLQIYTPKNSNNIAIEPLTGISNSFNNKEGLQTLKPNETFNINWKIEIK
jgi:aldose 1-epimerase